MMPHLNNFGMHSMGRHNHLAILAVVVIHQIVGFVWYSPVLFLSPWVHGQGKEVDQLNQSDPVPFVVSIATSILVSYVVSWLVQVLKADTVKRGAGVGGILGIGVAAPAITMHYAFLGMSWNVIAVDALHSIVLLGLTGGLLAAWRPKETPAE